MADACPNCAEHAAEVRRLRRLLDFIAAHHDHAGAALYEVEGDGERLIVVGCVPAGGEAELAKIAGEAFGHWLDEQLGGPGHFAVSVASEPIAAPSEPLATATTVIHPDDGDGPWVSLARLAVPRGVPGKRARIVVTNEEE